MSRRHQGLSLVVASTVILAMVVLWWGFADDPSEGAEVRAGDGSTTTSTTTTAAAVASTVAVDSTSVDPTSDQSPSSPPEPAPAPSPAPVLVTPRPVDPNRWTEVAAALPPLVLPSDCGLPLDEPFSLPNSPREYRGGIHQGVDFICLEPGRPAVAALAGRVVQANDTYVEPDPADRSRLLEDAQRLGRTPPWTLALLFGRFVVLDHGVVAGAGHVVTVYAHLEVVDPAMVPGAWVDVGQRVGEIGNRGTSPAATGEFDPRSIHLHWELHVDDVYLGAGLDYPATRALYAQLFDLG